MQATDGLLPARSQAGLKPTQQARGLFLSCQCFPEQDLAVALPDASGLSVPVRVTGKTPLNADVVALSLEPLADFSCRPGQYVNLVKDNLIRSYSVANLPDVDGCLELHIRRIPGGRMSGWIHDELAVGATLAIRGPAGDCFYTADAAQSFPILLAGTGTGLAPLEGICRDALRQGHRGPIVLIHGAPTSQGLYHGKELACLADAHPNLTFLQSTLDAADPALADVAALVESTLAALGVATTRVFLCGAPELVNPLKTKVFLKGAASAHIFSDPFLMAPAA